ncbi:ADP-heptose--LPS heptosyltransferase 2 [Dyadobacter sp. CECT 9275]|uniref:ADP-heptose--LPS heptosyltransferase 2 n=1 Tax=Dyadobacter helix TaxID=2822344 RepID=A0A916N2T4_9BACT|nr:glycosyltransferase family 9 protein [Dyadobacter sp. CECT 9275]CAG4991512.1 ADP-heptose--LPS heptosyltransferase 2 [Dyadobacter sp. CECT 9275]
MNKPVKFLILRFSSIGDIILTTPVVRCLKEQHPNAVVHYFTKEKFGFLLDHNPFVDKVWLLKKDTRQLLRELKKEQYDYIIDLHNNIRTLRIKLSLGTPSFSFAKLNYEKFLLTSFKINRMPDIHIVDRYLQTLHSFQVVNDNKGLDYFIPDKDIIQKEWLPITHRDGYVAYAIGGQHGTKKLPVNRMIELCRKINYPIVLLGGKEDFDAGKKITDSFEKELVYNACGQYNFNQSASILKQSLIVFTHDTGLMHVAAAFKKRTYSIWGNTLPAFGMYPYQTSFEVIENNNLRCRPCSKIGYKECPKKHFKCMTESSFDFSIKELPGNK